MRLQGEGWGREKSLHLLHHSFVPHNYILQHHSSKASILQHSAFFIVQLSHSYTTTGKTIALTRRTFVNKVMSLLFNMLSATAAAAKSLQLCPTLCDPIDGSPPGFPVPGILQARTLEWVAISFSNAWKWKVKVKLLSCLTPYLRRNKQCEWM